MDTEIDRMSSQDTGRAHAGMQPTALLQLVRDLRIAEDPHDVCWVASRYLSEQLGYLDSVIYWVDPARQCLRQVASHGPKLDTGEQILNLLEFPLTQGITGRAARSGETQLIEDASRDPDYLPDLVPVGSELAVPVFAGARVVAVIDLEDPDIGRFGAVDREAIELLAELAGAALDALHEPHGAPSTRAPAPAVRELPPHSADNTASLERVLAAIGHELRNPLGSMEVTVLLLNAWAENDNPGIRLAVERLRKAVRRFDSGISDLLAFSEQVALQREKVIAEQWLARLLDRRAWRRETHLHRQFSQRSARLYIDTQRLGRAIHKLLDNAEQAIGPGAGAEIRVISRVGDRNWEILIEDNGPGMDEAALRRALEPLYTTRPTAAGLGLPVAERVAARHSGKLELERAEGGGCRARLWLPLSEDENFSLPPAPPPPAADRPVE